MLRGLVVTVVGIVVGMVWCVPKALAGQWIVQTGCEAALVDGDWYPKVVFEVRNVFPFPDYPVEVMFAVPFDSSDAGESCRALVSEAPETWATFLQMDNGHVVWGRTSESSSTLLPGETLGGFGLVLSTGHLCCFDFYFTGAFPEPFAQERVCFECDDPVPVIGVSWGAVKAMYR